VTEMSISEYLQRKKQSTDILKAYRLEAL
jgi:hypothetical protein